MAAGVAAAAWETLVATALDSAAGPRLAPHPKLEANPPPYVLLIIRTPLRDRLPETAPIVEQLTD
ncbi:hypothetical protein MMARJ_35750 [Mycobacterium marseillense]|uniref:Transcriptional regulator n=1 Tax=Mycobacterium marseillense TaxID=701042 RepID=A0ABM7JFY2_9MYCO|nr:hypothetical protein MMARJ_35750 [Mycobacterium marseillense]